MSQSGYSATGARIVTTTPDQRDLFDLLGALCDGTITPQQHEQLQRELTADYAARQLYFEYLDLHLDLRRWPWDIDQDSEQSRWAERGSDETDSASIPSPVLSLGTAIHGPVSYFSSGWPVAYLIATVIFGVALLIGSLVPVSEQPAQLAGQSSVPGRRLPKPKMEAVGRITGMVDCKWVGTAFESPGVPLGRKYELASGLMEITYDTGARVILQGPATYEIESTNGGYLSRGKLTARLEKNVATGHWPLFTIKTPTAIVTDLGTEFGVEVDKHGLTTSHVFRGLVRVQMVAVDGNAQGSGQLLHENESVRVDGSQGQPKIVVVPAAKSASFIREIPKQIIKTLDLVDVVAGGNGFSGRRGRGINPTTGRIGNVQPDNVDTQGDYKYHRVDGIPFVDGVFIPEGSKGPVQIDSAGHVFPDCPKTDNWSWAHVWAGGKLPRPIGSRLSPTLEGIDYSSPQHAVLVMHANKGITFDLDAIRRSNPGHEVLRFRAVAGNVETESQKGANVSADIWVLVDGQVRFKRREFNGYNGAATVAIPIRATDRFLTLAATDAGNTYMCDQIIFGDPRLELATARVSVYDAK